ncbi:MAG: hypothetical protein AAFV19_14395 [Pseudomonadota bacterium]
MRVRRIITLLSAVAACAVIAPVPADAEVIAIPRCTGALACEIVDTPPNPVTPDPNNGRLLVWNEVQNVFLEEDLVLDRVADPGSPFVKQLDNGDYAVRAGTLVSSHYLQWDPSYDSSSFVTATIKLDAPVFGFIIDDEKLFASDAALGLPGLDYNDFWLRGLEYEDWTSMRDDEVEINWSAGSPGDWTRLITAGALIGLAPDAGIAPHARRLPHAASLLARP